MAEAKGISICGWKQDFSYCRLKTAALAAEQGETNQSALLFFTKVYDRGSVLLIMVVSDTPDLNDF